MEKYPKQSYVFHFFKLIWLMVFYYSSPTSFPYGCETIIVICANSPRSSELTYRIYALQFERVHDTANFSSIRNFGNFPNFLRMPTNSDAYANPRLWLLKWDQNVDKCTESLNTLDL
jgi:hypothetical protein